MTIGLKKINQMAIGQMTISQMTIEWRLISQMTIGQITIGKMPFGQINGQSAVILSCVPCLFVMVLFGVLTFGRMSQHFWFSKSINKKIRLLLKNNIIRLYSIWEMGMFHPEKSLVVARNQRLNLWSKILCFLNWSHKNF